MKKFFLFFIVIVVVLLPAITGKYSEAKSGDFESNLPLLLGANNTGDDFWVTIPPVPEDTGNGNPIIKFFVTCSIETSVTVENTGKNYKSTKLTKPYETIEFDLTPDEAQPYRAQAKNPSVPEQVFKGAGVHIYSGFPIIVYCLVKSGISSGGNRISSDGFLCLPTSALGSSYIVQGHSVDAMSYAIWQYYLPNITGIVAAFDDTKVRFTLGGNNRTKTAGGMSPGDYKEAVLMAGDVWMFSSKGDEGELSGSKIVSSKPVAVVTANECANVPTGNQWCSYMAEMNFPSFTWSTDLHVPKISGRRYSSIVKIFAKEPNTHVYRDGRMIGQLAEGGGMEGRGYLTLRMSSDMKPKSVIFSGDKPLGVTLYNCGNQEDGYGAPPSNPFTISTVPTSQYMNDVVFFTPDTVGGHNYKDNFINLVYQTDSLGMLPDDMMFGTWISGRWKWKRINADFAGMDELFSKDIGNKKYALKVIRLDSAGVFRIKALNPFAVYSYGNSDVASYGFPSAAGLKDLEKIKDTLPPVPTYTDCCCFNIWNGVISDMPNDDSVRSNLAKIIFHSDSSYNVDFSYDDFIPGQNKTTHWRMNATDLDKDARAMISFVDRAGNDTTLDLKYTGRHCYVIPESKKYKLVSGDSITESLFLINKSKSRKLVITGITLKRGDQNFTIDLMGKPLPFSVMPNDSVHFLIKFKAKKTGIFRDSIIVSDTCISNIRANFEAIVDSGSAEIIVNDIYFGHVMTSFDSTSNVIIKNVGTLPLRITGHTGPTDTAFIFNFPKYDSLNPLIINPGDSVLSRVDFKPYRIIYSSDSIVFQANTTITKNVCYLLGNGTVNGVEDNKMSYEKNEISITNPVSGRTILRFSSYISKIINIRIYDSFGKIMDEFRNPDLKVNIQSFEINTSGYCDGLYFLIVMTGEGQLTKKFIVVK